MSESLAPLPAPIGLLAELTHRCPLRCPYCSNPLELDRRSAELDTEDWLRVLSEAAALGVLQVHLSGGEPTAGSPCSTRRTGSVRSKRCATGSRCCATAWSGRSSAHRSKAGGWSRR